MRKRLLVCARRPSEPNARISCELDFLALLLVVSATAAQKGDVERAGIASDATRSFARDHLAEWVPLFCEALAKAAAEPLFAALARALYEVCRETVLSLGLEPAAAPAVGGGKTEDDESCCAGECPVH